MENSLKVNINPKDLKLLKCESCEHSIFQQKTAYKEVPALLSGTGKSQILTMAVAICDKCGEPHKRFLDQTLADSLKEGK